MAKGITLELLADIQGAPGDVKRVLGRDDKGCWYLVEIEASGARRILSEPVTPEAGLAAALAVMGGDARAITKHATVTTMAVFIVALMFMAGKGLHLGDPLPEPSIDTGGAPPPASAAAPPAAASPEAAGGDLFSDRS